ncbi:MAG: GNAT family N-acetyltransferase [Bacteroidota bacterium]
MSVTENGRIKVTLAETDDAYNHVFNIRTTVFVEEESIDQEDEYDGFDHLSTHYLATFDGIPAGTARWRTMLVSKKVRLERLAVLPAFRGKGVGAALIRHVLAEVPKQHEIFIHVQFPNLPFYEKYGFVPEGESFEEAGILHRKMVWKGQSVA